MAYAGYSPKYTLTFSDLYQDTTGQYIATILKKDYVGPVIEITGTSSPLTIETDRTGDSSYRPIIATKASLNVLIDDTSIENGWEYNTNIWQLYNQIWDDTGFDFKEFITADADTFMLEVKAKRPGDTYEVIWQGHYIYNTDVSLSEIFPIVFNLQFSDFTQSKINRFYNFPNGTSGQVQYFPSDKISLLEAFIRCAYFTKNTTSVVIEFPYSLTNTYVDGSGATVSGNPLLSTFIQKNAFLDDLSRYKTIYSTLEGLCNQFGLTSYFENGSLCIKSYKNLVNSTTRTSSIYQITGFNPSTDTVSYTLIDTVTENDSIYTLNSGVFRNIGRDQTVKFNYPVREVEITNASSKNFNTPNHTMASISQVTGTGGSLFYAINNWYGTDGKEAVFNFNNQLTVKPVALPFYPYATIKTQTFGTKYATRFLARQAAGFANTEYVDSEPFAVDSGDVFAFSYSALTDGRVKNDPSTFKPTPGVALIVQAEDANGNLVTYFYNAASGKFITNITNYPVQALLPLTTQVNYDGDSDRYYIDMKGVLDLPTSAKIRIRHYKPYRGVNIGFDIPRADIYLQYCNLQVFKATNVAGLPTKQTYKSYYSDTVNSESTLSLASNIFIQDSTKYVPTSLLGVNDIKSKNPLFVMSCYGNALFDSYYSPATGSNFSYANPGCINVSYTNLKNMLQDINENILANSAVVNSTIDGTYISASNFGIGTKYNYQVTGYDPKTFVLLDYSIDLKNATYNALLYSSEFTDTSDKTVQSQTIIE